MNIQTTARHVELAPAIRHHAEDNRMRALDGLPRISNARIILDVEKMKSRAEVVAHVLPHTVEVSAEADNLYAAIDLAMDKLSRQVTKWRERATDHKPHGERM